MGIFDTLLILNMMSLTAYAQIISGPSRNPFLSAEKYAITHFDPAQTDAMPYSAPRGTFYIDLRKCPRITGGPVGYMQLASTSPTFMWITSTGGVSYADVSNKNLIAIAQHLSPGAKIIPPEILDKVLKERFTDISEVEKAVTLDLGIDWSRITNNIYTLVDKDNVLYANAGKDKVYAYGLIDQKNPKAGIKVLRTLDFSETLQKLENGNDPSIRQYGIMIVALNLTYDGKLIILTNRSITVLDRSFEGPRYTIEIDENEYVSNSMAVDNKNGIYIASDKKMYKIIWTGSKLSKDEVDGAWSAPYDSGREPPSVKLGTGTGSTPTLMGFGDASDKLVVITDGSDQMNLVAFWRDEIPNDFKQQAGTKSKRIAGQIPVTCGFSPLPEFIQSEQSVVVNGYGAFVVNNIRLKGNKDRLIDVLAGGPIFDPPSGVERFEWDQKIHQWKSVWARKDIVSTSMVPTVSIPSSIVFVNGYTHKNGWEITGMDWLTGKTVHRTVFGQDNLGNGAYALIQFLPDGDMLFNSIGGAIRINFPKK